MSWMEDGIRRSQIQGRKASPLQGPHIHPVQQLVSSLQVIQQQLAEVGIKIDIELVETWNACFGRISEMDYEAVLFNRMMDYDPDNYAYWHSSQIAPNGANTTGYKNAELDQLLELERTTSDINQRKQYFTRIQQILAEDPAYIVMSFPKFQLALNKKVQGVTLSPHYTTWDVSTWWLSR